MKLLAIECSTPEGSVARMEGGVLVDETVFESPRGRGAAIFDVLARALEGWRPEGVLVGTGPGSYNGIRIAIAAGWGLARSRGIEVRGVLSILGYEEQDYRIAGDARAGQWFCAEVSDGRLAAGPVLVPKGDTMPGERLFTTTDLEIPGATILRPRARWLARHWETAGKPEPVYLKPPHITAPRPTAVEAGEAARRGRGI